MTHKPGSVKNPAGLYSLAESLAKIMSNTSQDIVLTMFGMHGQTHKHNASSCTTLAEAQSVKKKQKKINT